MGLADKVIDLIAPKQTVAEARADYEAALDAFDTQPTRENERRATRARTALTLAEDREARARERARVQREAAERAETERLVARYRELETTIQGGCKCNATVDRIAALLVQLEEEGRELDRQTSAFISLGAEADMVARAVGPAALGYDAEQLDNRLETLTKGAYFGGRAPVGAIHRAVGEGIRARKGDVLRFNVHAPLLARAE